MGRQVRDVVLVAVEGHTQALVPVGQAEDPVVEGLVPPELSVQLVGLVVLVDADVGGHHRPGLESAVEQDGEQVHHVVGQARGLEVGVLPCSSPISNLPPDIWWTP